MKIAFASKDNIYVNEHFGWCSKFFVYEIDEKKFSLVDELDSSLECEEEAEKLLYKIECIEGCDIVYALKIGPKASAMVQNAGIFPLKASNETQTIKDAIEQIQKLINNNQPLWLKRILLKGTQ